SLNLSSCLKTAFQESQFVKHGGRNILFWGIDSTMNFISYQRVFEDVRQCVRKLKLNPLKWS
uniref:Uncharacterized protein n=1 Tax=Amphiprion percula TaxID=161767 RepID=A0A3P8RVK4_AMPPE